MVSSDEDLVSSDDIDNSLDEEVFYSTPITSPESSPCKRRAEPCFTTSPATLNDQIDGVSDHDEYDGIPAEHKDNGDEPAIRQQELGVDGPISCGRALARPRAPCVLTSLQRLRLTKGIDFSDRFIPARNLTPTKERLLFVDSHNKTAAGGSTDYDPFVEPPTGTSRMSDYFSVTRYPGPALRSHGLAATNVHHTQDPTGSVRDLTLTWIVAGHSVTEGIASTTDGRGGRVTSSTNAPLYNASMLTTGHKHDVHDLHINRLAIAMEIDRTSKVINLSGAKKLIFDLPKNDIVKAGEKTVWKDSRWWSSRAMSKPTKKPPKALPTLPFKVLDAPELRNDYYCSPLAYSSGLRCLAVALGRNVYLWSDRKLTRPQIHSDALLFSPEYAHATSLSFSSHSGGKHILAVGCADGRLTLWDPRQENARLTYDQQEPISHVCFRPCTSRRQSIRDPNITIDAEDILVGTKTGKVMLFSVEWPEQDQCDLFDWSRGLILRTIISCHDQQICGTAWSASGEMFATGGNDNRLYVYDFDNVQQRTPARTRANNAALYGLRVSTPGAWSDQPVVLSGQEKQLFTMNAAVKAIAFAPWQPSLLAASGGSNDRCIHFLHAHSGATLATISCHAQVTSLIWNTTRKEIVATLGFAQPDHPYRIVTFAWPSCEQLTRISWPGEERALYAISYPLCFAPQRKSQECIVVATSDHSIKFHEVWREDAAGKKRSGGQAKSQILNDTCSEALENELQIR